MLHWITRYNTKVLAYFTIKLRGMLETQGKAPVSQSMKVGICIAVLFMASHSFEWH